MVIPKSSRQKIVISEDNQLKIHLTSPPIEGKANDELIKLLSRYLKMPKSNLEILHGQKGRKKIIALTGMTREQAIKKLKMSYL